MARSTATVGLTPPPAVLTDEIRLVLTAEESRWRRRNPPAEMPPRKTTDIVFRYVVSVLTLLFYLLSATS